MQFYEAKQKSGLCSEPAAKVKVALLLFPLRVFLSFYLFFFLFCSFFRLSPVLILRPFLGVFGSLWGRLLKSLCSFVCMKQELLKGFL
jgi:hypothetical protein